MWSYVHPKEKKRRKIYINQYFFTIFDYDFVINRINWEQVKEYEILDGYSSEICLWTENIYR